MIFLVKSPADFCDVHHIVLENASGVSVGITNYGATLTSIHLPSRDGRIDDVCLGYDSLGGYLNALENAYFGCTVGRVANRIAAGRTSLDGSALELATNNHPNHLHGGSRGFDTRVWELAAREKDSVLLCYHSPDGEEGYPGNLRVSVRFRLDDSNALHIGYEAATDAPTLVNLTNHAYFNLRGSGDILGHELEIFADHFTPIDERLIPTGEVRAVQGTPFDFRKIKPIGRDIDTADPQLTHAGGYDHNWVLDAKGPSDSPKLAARAFEPSSGRSLEVWTTEPGIQFYSGNFLSPERTGKGRRPFIHRGGFCLETQHFPDASNHSHFPTIRLKPGDTFRSSTLYRFAF